MSMSRKDYTAFAEVLNDAVRRSDSCATNLVIEDIARDMARVFKADNGRFDTERFLDAALAALNNH